MQGTDAYNAPERSNKADMRKADVWALGCVLYELFSGGKRLCSWANEAEKYRQLAMLWQSGWTPPRLPANMAGWQEPIDAMLVVDPAHRALPAQVLRLGNFRCTLCCAWQPCCQSSCTTSWSAGHLDEEQRPALQLAQCWQVYMHLLMLGSASRGVHKGGVSPRCARKSANLHIVSHLPVSMQAIHSADTGRRHWQPSAPQHAAAR